jgi:hypothetical protein
MINHAHTYNSNNHQTDNSNLVLNGLNDSKLTNSINQQFKSSSNQTSTSSEIDSNHIHNNNFNNHTDNNNKHKNGLNSNENSLYKNDVNNSNEEEMGKLINKVSIQSKLIIH